MVCGKGPSIGGKIKKEAKRFGNKVKNHVKDAGEDALDITTAGGYSLTKKVFQKIGDYVKPEIPDIIIEGDQAETAAQYVMPDEEEIRKARRRRGAASRSGRSATIMSGDSTETLGG
ncbi:MAG: hypothetical protein RL651_1787 [Pseudomonadota bacterium]|jgi:hypothetical protein